MVEITRLKTLPLLCILLALGTAFGQWKSLGGSPGTNGSVRSMLQVGDSIIVGGNFTIAGDKAAKGVAIWNGIEWHPMGEGFVGGCSKLVRTSSGKIYTIGFGTPFENKPLGYLETWTGTEWKTEDVEYNFETVRDMIVDSQDRIWISGFYYKTSFGGQKVGILIFDGESWTEVPNVFVYTMAMGNSGEIYAGGSFTAINGIPARNVAKYQAGIWSSLGNGINGRVNGLIVGKSGRLYAVGDFDSAGTTEVSYSAVWDEEDRWRDPQMPFGNGFFLYKDSEGKIYYSNNGSVYEFIEPTYATQPGTFTWITRGGVYGSSDTVSFYSAVKDNKGTLLIGGSFRFYFQYVENVGNSIYFASNITKWLGTHGVSLGIGMDGPITDLSPGPNGDLLATGNMIQAQGNVVDKIGIWNGSSLTGFPQALYAKGTNINYQPYTTTVWQSNIVVGGSFNLMDIRDQRIGTNVAKWEGQAWASLSSLNSPPNKLITSPQGELIAGTNTGAWKWNGTEWTTIGSKGELSGYIYDMAWDASGQLWVAGTVSMSNGTASLGLAMWNGTNWIPQGVGVNGSIYSIAIGKDGAIYAGGDFQHAYNSSISNRNDITSLNCLGKWNGKAWLPIGKGANGTINEVLFDPRGNLLVGGNFSKVSNADGNSVPTGNLALWSGAAWHTFGSGTNGPITAMGFDKNGNLLVSGNFSKAGDVVSSYWALLNYPDFLANTRKHGLGRTQGTKHALQWYTLKGERVTNRSKGKNP